MVTVEINNGAAVVQVDFTPGMTVSDLRQEVASSKAGQYITFNSFELYDPSQNRHLGAGDEIVDERLYFCSAWVQTVSDEDGNRLTSL